MTDKPKKKLTPKQRKFLAVYATAGSIKRAAELAGVNRSMHFEWIKQTNSQYVDAFTEAKEQAICALEDEAVRRATEGLIEYQFCKDGTPKRFPDGHPDAGKPYYIHKYSDHLLALLLKALRPDKYRENASVQLSTAADHDFVVNHEFRQDVLNNPALAKALCDALNHTDAESSGSLSSDGDAGGAG